MIIFIYNLLLTICLIIALPFLIIFLPKKELMMRLGINRTPNDEYLWFHCASVGELNAVKPLLTAIKQKNENKNILVTTMTVTGFNSCKEVPEINQASLLPFDLVLLYYIFIKRCNPQVLIIVETELWFSLFQACKLFKIPVLIVNGRISDKSYDKYYFISKLFRKLFSHVKFVGAQSLENKKRYESLGFKNVYNTHNLKFCTELPEVNKETVRSEWHIDKNAFVITWGSSREGEEELLLSIYSKLKRNIPNLHLIIAPRHINRLSDIKILLNKKKYTLLSEITHNSNIRKSDNYNVKTNLMNSDIMIIDSMGKLVYAYATADLAIIGGSFFDYGGHNPLEPLYYETSAIIGNFHSSCRDLICKLVEDEAIVVSSTKKLSKDIISLASNKSKRKELGEKGKQTIVNNSCSVKENLYHIEKYVDLV